jgi:hypothetical protein
MTFSLDFTPDWILSGKDYWFALVSAAVVGVICGILLTEWRFAKSEASRNERQIHALLESVRFNVGLIDIALGYTDLKRLGNFLMDGTTLGASISACVDALPPAETIKSLNWERFQLDHIAFKVLVSNITVSTAGHISTSPGPPLTDVPTHLRGM